MFTNKNTAVTFTTGYPTKTVSDLIDIPIGFFAISVKSGYHIKTKIKRPVLLVPRLLRESSFILRKMESPPHGFLAETCRRCFKTFRPVRPISISYESENVEHEALWQI